MTLHTEFLLWQDMFNNTDIILETLAFKLDPGEQNAQHGRNPLLHSGGQAFIKAFIGRIEKAAALALVCQEVAPRCNKVLLLVSGHSNLEGLVCLATAHCDMSCVYPRGALRLLQCQRVFVDVRSESAGSQEASDKQQY